MTTTDWRKLAFEDYSAQRQIKLEEIEKARVEANKFAMIAAEREAELAELDRAAAIFNIVAVPISEPSNQSIGITQEATAAVGAGEPAAKIDGGFKDIALATLENVYPRSLKASELQRAVERKLLRQFHYKTAGMTLFRFSKEGLVRREGRNWFFVPPSERAQKSTATETRTILPEETSLPN